MDTNILVYSSYYNTCDLGKDDRRNGCNIATFYRRDFYYNICYVATHMVIFSLGSITWYSHYKCRKLKKLRVHIPSEIIIELGSNEKIVVRATRFSDYPETGEIPFFGDLTKNGTDFSSFVPIAWGIYHSNKTCMNKNTGKFEWEPMSSSITNEHRKLHRFSSIDEAIETYLKFHADVNPLQRGIDIRLNSFLMKRDYIYSKIDLMDTKHY